MINKVWSDQAGHIPFIGRNKKKDWITVLDNTGCKDYNLKLSGQFLPTQKRCPINVLWSIRIFFLLDLCHIKYSQNWRQIYFLRLTN